MSEPEAQKDGPVGQTVGASSPLAKSRPRPSRKRARRRLPRRGRSTPRMRRPPPLLAPIWRRRCAARAPRRTRPARSPTSPRPNRRRWSCCKRELAPVYAQIPKDCDLFDARLLPGARPRLSIDRIAFVEMAPDGRRFSFLQDMHLDRVVLAKTGDVDKMAGTSPIISRAASSSASALWP